MMPRPAKNAERGRFTLVSLLKYFACTEIHACTNIYDVEIKSQLKEPLHHTKGVKAVGKPG